MTHGLVVGTFLPLHVGHLALCDAARAASDRVTIVLRPRWDDPIPWDVRWRWLVESCPWARVVSADALLPHAPLWTHDHVGEEWRAALQQLAPDVTHVFSLNEIGRPVAEALGAELVTIAPQHPHAGIRAIDLRRDPWRHWELLAPAARSWFTRTVALVGGESVGKSTLSAQLAEAFDTVWVDEYGRTYTTGISNATWVERDAILVTDAQQVLITEARRKARGLCISDTEAIVTAIWTEFLGQPVPAHVWEVAARQPIDLFLLCEPDLAWEHDPVRVGHHDRDWFRDRLEFHLERLGKPWVRVSGAGPARLESAKAAIATACDQWWHDLRAWREDRPGSGIGR